MVNGAYNSVLSPVFQINVLTDSIGGNQNAVSGIPLGLRPALVPRLINRQPQIKADDVDIEELILSAEEGADPSETKQ